MGSNFTTLPMRPRTSALPDRFTAALSARNSRSNLPRSASCAVSTISAKLVPELHMRLRMAPGRDVLAGLVHEGAETHQPFLL